MGRQHAFVWQDGVTSQLPDLAGGTATATAIIDRGDVVGVSADGQGNVHAVVWRGREIQDLGTLGGPFSFATAINDEGLIVGSGRINNEPPVPAGPGVHALLWNAGTICDLGDLVGGVGRSEASGVNDRGKIVGRITTASGNTHAVVWKPLR
jgi:probable HAF family extracellular repeat protein